MFLVFNPIANFCTLSPSMLQFRKYFILSFHDFRLDEFPRDLLIVNRVVSKGGRLHLSGFTDPFQIIDEIMTLLERLVNDLARAFFKAFDNDFTADTSSSLLDSSSILGFI